MCVLGKKERKKNLAGTSRWTRIYRGSIKLYQTRPYLPRLGIANAQNGMNVNSAVDGTRPDKFPTHGSKVSGQMA